MDMTQDGLARLIRATGIHWTAVTVAKVEAGEREVKAGELIGLGLALDMSPSELVQTSGRVRLSRADDWIPGDAVSTWADGRQPTDHQRAQWARQEGSGAAPLRFLDGRARRLAAYLSHLPEQRRPDRLSMKDVDAEMRTVATQVDEWATARLESGQVISEAARRAKTRHIWAAVRRAAEAPPPR